MADLTDLLVRTSRTFALAIPLLPEPLATEVTVAYLLFRIADTFEDATHWPREARLAELERFDALLATGERASVPALAEQWVKARPVEHEGYLDLLRDTPAVLAALDGFRPAAREAIVRHTRRTTQGMAEVVRRADEKANLRLGTLEQLREYCYIVAGIVGEMLTDLFLLEPALAPAEGTLREHAVAFGEALQLVNILKDAADDARDGRVYVPAELPRPQVLALAREDLARAQTYVLALQSAGAHRGVLAFTALPVLLARATLDRVEAQGPGAKIERHEVARMMGELQGNLDSGAPAL